MSPDGFVGLILCLLALAVPVAIGLAATPINPWRCYCGTRFVRLEDLEDHVAYFHSRMRRGVEASESRTSQPSSHCAG